MQDVSLIYLFDPLCGWCYARAPVVTALAERYPTRLRLLPSGLFSGSGARPLTAEFAAHAWSNDMRIAALTGQPFSDAYRQNILQADNARFDSTMMNRALTLCQAIHPEREVALLHALQQARYVTGRNTSQAGIVAEVASPLLQLEVAMVAQRLSNDEALSEQDRQRIHQAQLMMQQLHITGVPQLLLQRGDEVKVISSEGLNQSLPAALAGVANEMNAAG